METVKQQFKTSDSSELDTFWASSIGSVSVGMIFLFSLVASILTDAIGVRATAITGGSLATLGLFLSSFATSRIQIWLSYGFLFGIGASLCYTPSLVILGHYFEKRLGVVNGVVTAGSSIFSIIMSLALESFVKTLPLQQILLILTGFMAILILCGFTFIERPRVPTLSVVDYGASDRDENNFNHGALSFPRRFSNDDSGIRVTPASSVATPSIRMRVKSILRRELWTQNQLYVIWVISLFVGLFGYFVPFYNVVAHFTTVVKDTNKALPITVITASSGVARLLFGIIADLPWINRVFLQQVALAGIGLLTLALCYANSCLSLLLICLGIGLFDGCFISVLSPIAFDLVGRDLASQAVGSLLAIISIPLTVGPMAAGYILDCTGSYQWAFLYAGIPPIVGAFLMIPVMRGTQKKAARLRTTASFSDSQNGDVGRGFSTTNYVPSTQTSRSDIPSTPNGDIEGQDEEDPQSHRTVLFEFGPSSSQEDGEDVFEDPPPTYNEATTEADNNTTSIL